MKKNIFLMTLTIAALVLSGSALAQNEKPEPASRTGPPNFGPAPSGTGCQGESVSDMAVTLQIQHTWVGDIDATLASPDSSQFIVNRVGQPALGGFGCSNDDIDAVLNAGGTGDVENVCNAAPPAVDGVRTSSPGDTAGFNGETFSGDWTLTVTDNAGGDSGRLLTWCIGNAGGDACCSSPDIPTIDNDSISDTISLGGGTTGTTGTGTPAVGTWGIIAMISLLLAVSLFHFRRRAEQL